MMVARESSTKTELEPADNGENTGKRITAFPQTALERELRYLTDPLKLAQNTLDLLRRDEHVKALELVRLASRKMPCTVSWNHIIDYDMNKDKVNAAWKTYNEMKKRAQPPDAYTYTILLRGLAAHTMYPQSLPRALTVYSSMYAENSPVRPSIIHTNAILKVCAQAQDLDAIFDIAAKMPSKGKGAPNIWTYTTIINAIINAAQHESENIRHHNLGDPDNAMKPVHRAVDQGRRMWVDIIGRWRNGEIQIDERIVCAMGRLLLIGHTEQDCDDVLSLVEQTMGIQRKIPRLGDPTRMTHITVPRAVGHKPKASTMDELSEPERVGDPAPSAEDDSSRELGATGFSNSTSNSLQQPFSDSSPGSASAIQYPNEFDPIPLKSKDPPRGLVRPSHPTLSLLVTACTFMHAPSTAQSYWGLLTSAPYNITPDGDNMHTYLRLLRLARASRLASTLVFEMATPRNNGGLGITVLPKTFRIAMSTCVRDAKNPHMIGYAEKILRLMNERLEEPDLKATLMFVAVLEKVCSLNRGRNWRSILVALENLEVSVGNLRSMLAYGSWRPRDAHTQPATVKDLDEGSPFHADENETQKPSRSPDHQRNLDASAKGRIPHPDTRLTVRQILQRMVTLYDRVRRIAGEALSQNERTRLNINRPRLQAWIEREMKREGVRMGGKKGDYRERRFALERGEEGSGGKRVEAGREKDEGRMHRGDARGREREVE
ncbi:hypothetical protein MMC30_000425 [Trapelia coarctata]|nr:hypothetical protein [Trapelia coarctata]